MKSIQSRLILMAAALICLLPFDADADIYVCQTQPIKISTYRNYPSPNGRYGQCSINSESIDDGDKFICEFVTDSGETVSRKVKSEKVAFEEEKCRKLNLEPEASKTPKRWELFGGSEGSLMWVDRQSISMKGIYKKAWFKEEYTAPKKYWNFEYDKAQTLYLFHCSERTLATTQRILYMNGKVINSSSLNPKSADFQEAPPESIGETMLNSICRNSERSKAMSK